MIMEDWGRGVVKRAKFMDKRKLIFMPLFDGKVFNGKGQGNPL